MKFLALAFLASFAIIHVSIAVGVTPQPISLPVAQTVAIDYGYDADTQTFTNNDGIVFKNTTKDFYKIMDVDGNVQREWGFGITSVREDNNNSFNRSVFDLEFEWEFIEYENISYTTNGSLFLEPEDTIIQERVDKWIQTYNQAGGDWIITADFDLIDSPKFTHQIFNDFRNLSQTRLWYVFTVNSGETAVYDGEVYDLDADRHITGNLNNKAARVEFPFETFDFSDVLEDYIVTDIFVGNATMFNLPNERIFGIGIAKQEGGSRFIVGKNVTVDPTIILEVSKSGVLNVTKEAFPLSHITVNDTDPATLMLYLPFDVPFNTSIVYDFSEEDLNGAPNGAVPNSTNGLIGSAATFSNTAGDGITFGDIDRIDNTAELSGMAWVYHESISDDDNIISKSDVGGNNGFALFRDDVASASIHCTGRTDYYSVFVSDGSDTDIQTLCADADSSTAGAWTHVAFTFISGNATGLRIYVNGVEAADSPRSTSTIGDINAGFVQLEVGEFIGAIPFNGVIDEVMLFNRSLSAEEINNTFKNQSHRFKTPAIQLVEPVSIQQNGSFNMVNITTNSTLNFGANISLRIHEWNGTHYNDTIDGDSESVVKLDEIVGYWHFDNRTPYENDTLVFDWSANDNNGTVVDAVFNSTAKFAGAYEFDEDNDYIEILEDSSLKFGTGDMSFSAWVYPETSQSVGSRIGDGRGTGNFGFAGWQMKIFNSSITKWGFYDTLIVDQGSSWLGCSVSFCSSTRYDFNEWSHVAMTFDNSDDTLRVYANGDLIFTDTTVTGGDSAIGNITNNRNLSIGAAIYTDGSPVTPLQEFDGLIDEAILWNKTLSDNEIARIYSVGRLKFDKSTIRQNITGGDNQITNFSVLTTTEQIVSEFEFIPDSNNFYSSILRENIVFESFSVPEEEAEADTTPPDVTINFPAAVNYSGDDLPFNFNVTLNENGSVIYSLDSGINNITMTGDEHPFGTHFNATNSSIADGNYLFTAYANDTAGNNNFTETINFTIDTIAPSLTIVSPIDGSLFTINDVNYTITVSDSLLTVDTQTYSIDGAANVSFDGSSIVNNGQGTFKVTFCANDTVNNINCSSTTYSVVAGETTTGGGGGGSGSGVAVELERIEVEAQNVINVGDEYDIIVRTISKGNNSIDIDRISIFTNTTNITIASEVITRLEKGVYQRTFELFESEPDIIRFVIEAEKGTVTIVEVLEVRVKRPLFSAVLNENIKNAVMSIFDKIMEIFRQNGIMIGSTVIIIVIVLFIVFNRRRR